MIKRLVFIFLSIFIINFLQISDNILPLNINDFFSNKANAKELIKINNINFDNSDSIIFLGTTGLKSIESDPISKVKLSNPDRIYFDIENAVLTRPNAVFEFRNSSLDQLKIAQFSTNPNIVRIVITYNSDLNPNNIKLLRHDGNLIIKYKNTTPVQNFLMQIYRELKQGPFDLFETARVVEVETTTEPISVQPPVNNDMFNQIQQAFGTTPVSPPPQAEVPPASTVKVNTPLKEPKLRSRYFIEKMVSKQGNILISGVGIVSLEKSMYLTEPSRVVFDFSNTIVAQDLRNKEIQLNETETIRLGQFEPTKARLVIITPNPQKYRAVFAPDLQNILIAHDDRMSGVKLSGNTANITSLQVKQIDQSTDDLTIDFSSPVVHSLKRDNTGSKLELYLYNARYTSESYKEQVRNTSLYTSKLDYLPSQGVKLTIPIEKETTVECFENLTATKIYLSLKTPQSAKKQVKNPYTATPQSIKGRIVVLDPGHGGADTGALKAGIAEKDINLDIAKKLAAELTNRGIAVEMTRWDNSTVSLQDRVEFSNAKKTALFVSIHINSSVKPEVHGIETHYYTDAGFQVAKIIHKSLISKICELDRGLFKSKFYVINHTEAPSVLLELGFLSNDNERNALLTEERKKKSAEAIAEGIINYLKTQPKE